MEARKRAILRRHAYGTQAALTAKKSPHAEEEEQEQEDLALEGSHEKTWAQKRAENLKVRANGGRPASTEVSLTAVSFASKLMRASGVTSERSEISLAEGSRSDAGMSPDPMRKPVVKETPWSQKRKEHLMARAGHKKMVEQTDVALKSVSFIAKLQQSQENSERSQQEAPRSTDGTPRPKSALQRRKESYLVRHGGQRPHTAADVAFTAVAFATKLKVRSSRSTAASEPNQKRDASDDEVEDSDRL